MSREPKTFSIGRVTGSGPSDTAAKNDALAKARVILSGNFDPIVIPFRDHLGFTWRGPEGWCSTILRPGQGLFAGAPYPGICLHGVSTMPRYGVELSLRSHLAQMTWDGAETVSPVLAAGASRLSAEEDWALASAQDQFARWASWQIRTGKVRHDIQAAGISSERATELLQPLLSGQRPEWVLLELARVGLSAETLIAALAA